MFDVSMNPGDWKASNLHVKWDYLRFSYGSSELQISLENLEQEIRGLHLTEVYDILNYSQKKIVLKFSLL